MDINNSKILLGGAANKQATYVDDVFSTFLYTGNSTARSINNGIDLNGEGGMVWIKRRDGTDSHALFDTERGVNKGLRSNTTDAELADTVSLTSFNSNGFSLGTGYNHHAVNLNNSTHCSWTFRKCPDFFDVVTYVGNGLAGRTVAHNLGSVPGSIWIRRLNSSEAWCVYHRSIGTAGHLRLNITTNYTNGPKFANVTSTSFDLYDNDVMINGSGDTYVAYIFAHNSINNSPFGDNGDEAIIKCASYIGNGTTNNEVNVGFEPQWLLIKLTSANGHSWYVFDSMRGIVSDGNDASLLANATNAEDTSFNPVELTPTGFKLTHTGTNAVNGNSQTYVYIAIRRPHKPPSAGTDVFAVDTRGSLNDGKEPTYRAPFPVDLFFTQNVNYSGGSMPLSARLTQGRRLKPHSNAAEGGNSSMQFDYMNGVQNNTGSSSDQYGWMLKRAPGVLDVVTYVGQGQNYQISHNLNAVPQLIIVKQRDATRSWAVYSAATGTGKFLKLEGNDAAITQSGIFDTAPTSSTFTVATNTYVNASGGDYIAYLFGNANGISKVGSYTGTGSTIDVDCGFTNGARFVLIKRWDSPGNWILFDSLRGIVSGNDPFLALNINDAQDSNYDAISPYGAGFVITATGPNDVNTSGGSYLFLAIS